MFDHSLGPCSRHNCDTTGMIDLNDNENIPDQLQQQKQEQQAGTSGNGWNADVVMIFGVTPLMASISRKLQSECKPGTYILAYRFAIPLFHPSTPTSSSTMDDSSKDLLHGQIVYDLEEMRIYEKKDDISTEHDHHHSDCKDNDDEEVVVQEEDDRNQNQ